MRFCLKKVGHIVLKPLDQMMSKVIHNFLRSTQSYAPNQNQVELRFSFKFLNKLVTLSSGIHCLEADNQGFPIPPLPHPTYRVG